MKTLYNSNYYEQKAVWNDSAFVFSFFIMIIILLHVQGKISYFAVSLWILLWSITIYYLKKNWETFVSFFRMFILRKENLYSKDMLFYYIENINQKFYPEQKRMDNNSKINLDKEWKTNKVKNI